jgi:hypothetical protein
VEQKFIALHFHNFFRCPKAVNALAFSLLSQMISEGSLRLESEDSLYDFISRGIRTIREMFDLLEFARLE